MGDPLARPKKNATAATVGDEVELWQMADALRGSMDAAEYKPVVLGLIFLKYISDAFEERHAKLVAEKAQGADPENPDDYRAQNIFWAPLEVRWSQRARRVGGVPRSCLALSKSSVAWLMSFFGPKGAEESRFWS